MVPVPPASAKLQPPWLAQPILSIRNDSLAAETRFVAVSALGPGLLSSVCPRGPTTHCRVSAVSFETTTLKVKVTFDESQNQKLMVSEFLRQSLNFQHETVKAPNVTPGTKRIKLRKTARRPANPTHAICHTPQISPSQWLFFLGDVPYLELRLVLELSFVSCRASAQGRRKR